MLLECDYCNKSFEKLNGEYNRRIKVKPSTKFFCSRSCSTSYSHIVSPRKGNPSSLVPGNRLDQYSPFKYFVRKAKARKHEYDIDVKYLKRLWEAQKGVCAISGIEMLLPKNSQAWEKDVNNPWKPSLDRIDSSQGYIEGNVQFICYIANMCKQTWSIETVIEFAKMVAEYNEKDKI